VTIGSDQVIGEQSRTDDPEKIRARMTKND